MDAGKAVDKDTKGGLGVFNCPHCEKAVGFLYPVDAEVGEELLMAAMDVEDIDSDYVYSSESSELPQGEERLEEEINFLRKTTDGLLAAVTQPRTVADRREINNLERSYADISSLWEYAQTQRETKV